MATALRKVDSSKAVDVSELLKEVSVETTGFTLDAISGAAKQDAAAKKVAKVLNLEVETCDMHDGDKVGQSAVGELTRKDGHGNTVNPFDEGLALISKLRKQARHFTSTHSNRVSYRKVLEQNKQLPKCSIEDDKNGTRVASVYNLIRSSLM